MLRLLLHIRWFFLLLFFTGQNASAQLRCGTPIQSKQETDARENKILQLKIKLATANLAPSNGVVRYIPIRAHVLRQSNGTGGVSLANLNSALAQLNAYYLSSDLQFYYCAPQPNYIDNTAFYEFDNSEESALCDPNSVSNAINVYFPNSIAFGSLAVSGYAYFPSQYNAYNRVFVQATSLTDNRTFAHELGHYFNLYHTFQGSTEPTATELVTRGSGSNCASKGDWLCDTPADPYGQANVSVSGCTYTGTATDANGAAYNPSLTNIMSYFYGCGNIFTGGQLSRMVDGHLLRTDPINDYTLNCPPTVLTAPNNLTEVISMGGVVLSFDDMINEAGYIIERSVVSATAGFVPLAGLPPNVTTYTDYSVSANQNYYYRVKASNATDAYSNVETVNPGMFYCLPQYTNKCTSFPVLIDDFIVIGTTLSNRDSNCSPNSYGDFTATPHNVVAGTSYSFTARAVANGSGSYFEQHLTIWIDFNQNGIYETAERVFQSTPTTTLKPSVTGLLSFPNTLAAGLYRMRVRSSFANSGVVDNPCTVLVYGETEDYRLNVTAPVVANTITTASISPTTYCAGSTVSVGYTTSGSFGANNSFKVQMADFPNGVFIDVSIQKNITPITAFIPANTGNGIYQFRVVSSNPSLNGTVSPTLITINALPSSPSVSGNITYCQNDAAIPLSATGSSLRWYNAQTDGVFLGTSATPSTASAGGVPYFVSQTVNNCESSRTRIDVNTTPRPLPPTVNSPVNYLQGQTPVPLVANGSNLRWFDTATGGVSNGSTPTPSTANPSTVSYWVSQTVSGCESGRTKIDVVVSAPLILDSDGDGISNQDEDANSSATNKDSDGDGVADRDDLDADNDGINDVREVGGTDADGDGRHDLTTKITLFANTDADNWPNYLDLDSDNDGFGDLKESGNSPIDADDDGTVDGPDNDGDGIRNSADALPNAKGDSNDPLPINTDGLGKPDYCDLDSNNDGINDIEAAGDVDFDLNNDGMIDNNSDPDRDGIANVIDQKPTVFGGISSRITFVYDLKIKVFLQGAYNQTAGLMQDSLRSKNYIPTTEPYTNLGFVQVGSSSGKTIANASVLANTGSNSVVDWVLIEFRGQADSLIKKTVAALVQRDGDVVAPNGGQLLVQGLPDQRYFVVIRHRNHLGICTRTAVSFTENIAIDLDFTTMPPAQLFGNVARFMFANGRYAMWAGDLNLDKRGVFQGSGNDPQRIKTNNDAAPGNVVLKSPSFVSIGYQTGDLNMDGRAIFQGSGNDSNRLYNIVTSHSNNILASPSFIIKAQIPPQ